MLVMIYEMCSQVKEGEGNSTGLGNKLSDVLAGEKLPSNPMRMLWYIDGPELAKGPAFGTSS